MKNNNHTPPKFREEAFCCPFCNVVATQKWRNDESFLKGIFDYQNQFFLDYRANIFASDQTIIRKFINDFHRRVRDNSLGPSTRHFLAMCGNCNNCSIWIDGKMVYPLASSAPLPAEDMPDDVKKIYEEARQVHPHSLRATAALLRVALETLTVHFGETKGSLNTRIGNLQKQGLSQRVIDSLDIVRIVGNEGGSHSGQIDLEGKDNEDVVDKLFILMNLIIRETITDNKTIDFLTDKLPESKKAGIENRDKN